MASPLVFAPGSSFKRKGATRVAGLASFNIMTNGNLRRTAAFPCVSKIRARAGVHGIKGLRWASTTRIRDMVRLLLEAPIRGQSSLVPKHQRGKVFLAHVIE